MPAATISLNYRFLAELGWDEATRAADLAHAETWLLRHWFEIVITARPIADSIAALSFTAERLNPEVLGRVYEGLKKNYSISDEGLMSLAVHASHVEEEHGSLGPVAFERYATTAYDQARIRFAVLHTAEVYYNMLQRVDLLLARFRLEGYLDHAKLVEMSFCSRNRLFDSAYVAGNCRWR